MGVKVGVGDGLAALYRSVVDDFQGQLSLRSGSVFLNLKAGNATSAENRSYAAKLSKYPDEMQILGNMITVRLPITWDQDR